MQNEYIFFKTNVAKKKYKSDSDGDGTGSKRIDISLWKSLWWGTAESAFGGNLCTPYTDDICSSRKDINGVVASDYVSPSMTVYFSGRNEPDVLR